MPIACPSEGWGAIDRATRFVHLEILAACRAATAAAFLARFPLDVHTILTDNGSEFTDRFAADKKAKPKDRPSGDHAFDRVCARMPQNRAAHHRRFLSHAERDACLHTFVADYNRTRLRCLDYQAPAELLAKLAGHNTKAGTHCSAVLDNALD
jgi:hypothetical protein